jgi:TusA-related sulfurtransferase
MDAVTRDLDIRGVLCPITWVRVRVALDQMGGGDTLRVLVDHRPAVPDIQKNADELGHDVLAAEDRGAGVWEILIRKN